MKLIKAYDYFTKYKENNPQLNLTEEDVRNVSILTFNESCEILLLSICCQEDKGDS